MPRRARRRAAVASLLLVPALGACGFGVQTNQVYQPAVGDNVRGETVDVLGAVVLSTSDGTGTFSGALVNTDLEDEVTLTGITGEGLEVTLAAPVTIQPDTLVDLTSTGNAYVEGEGLVPGANVTLELEFDTGETATMRVPVVNDEGVFGEITEAEPAETTTDAPTEPAEPAEPAEPSESAAP